MTRLSLSLGFALVMATAACGDDGSGGANTGGANTGGANTGGAGGAGGEPGPGCNPVNGIGAPLPVCSASEPCTKVLAGGDPIAVPSNPAVCRTTDPDHAFFDDPALSFVDAEGVERTACFYKHPAATAGSARPLLVWFHASGSNTSALYDLTSLRQKAVTADLGDGPGFSVLAIQSRNLHWPTDSAQDGPKHDTVYRDLASPSDNPDIANADRFIDEIVAAGGVDPARIYVSGWSNGARFAQAYAIARHETATPGGSRIAAAAVYSGADPFNNTSDSQEPSCQLDPYPQSSVPIFIVSRACDLMACDEAQRTDLLTEGAVVEPGSVMTTWVADLASKVGDPNVQWTKLSGIGTVVNACSSTSVCSKEVAALNHIRWPDGLANGDGGNDHEPAMLAFLAAHSF